MNTSSTVWGLRFGTQQEAEDGLKRHFRSSTCCSLTESIWTRKWTFLNFRFLILEARIILMCPSSQRIVVPKPASTIGAVKRESSNVTVISWGLTLGCGLKTHGEVGTPLSVEEKGLRDGNLHKGTRVLVESNCAHQLLWLQRSWLCSHLKMNPHVPSNEVTLLTEYCTWESNTVTQCVITAPFLKLLMCIFYWLHSNILSKSPRTQETKIKEQIYYMRPKTVGNVQSDSWWCHSVHWHIYTQPHRLPTHKYPVSFKMPMEAPGVITKLGDSLSMGHSSRSPCWGLGRLLTGGY